MLVVVAVPGVAREGRTASVFGVLGRRRANCCTRGRLAELEDVSISFPFRFRLETGLELVFLLEDRVLRVEEASFCINALAVWKPVDCDDDAHFCALAFRACCFRLGPSACSTQMGAFSVPGIGFLVEALARLRWMIEARWMES